MSISVKNDYPIDPNSPSVIITSGSGKSASKTRVAPQQTGTLGQGDINITLEYPKAEGDEPAEAEGAK